VDVEDNGTNVIRILEVLESGQELHPGARSVNRNNVGIEGGDRFDDVVEFALAHMGVDLGLIADTGRGQLERHNRPRQVAFALGFMERQIFAKGRLVDLKWP
jgi:hypothetical protein